jgi:hypothetical protein
LKILLKEVGYDYKEPMRLYWNKKAAIHIARNPVQHERTKHIEIDKTFYQGKNACMVDLYTFCEDRGATCEYLNKGSVCSSFSLVQARHARHLHLRLRGSIEDAADLI